MSFDCAVTIPNEYGITIFAILLLGLFSIQMGFTSVLRERLRIFNKDFMKQHFQEEHFAATGTDIPATGFPDMGSGRYSQKLSYIDWLNFNKKQRIHQNLLEQLPQVMIFTLFGGLYQPIAAAVFVFVYILARISYGHFYMDPQGPVHPLRTVSFVLANMMLMSNLILSILAALKMLCVIS